MGGGLDEADVVLVGVSRTSKTPLSMYLGYLGYKTANVPIVRGIEPPQDSWGEGVEGRRPDDRRGPARRDPSGAGAQRWAARGNTPELVRIYGELAQAEVVHRRLGCPVLDVSSSRSKRRRSG